MDNKIYNIPDWKIIDGTASNVSNGFDKIFPRSDGHWYSKGSDGIERQIAHSLQIGSGLVSSSPTASLYDALIQVNIDSTSGLTTSNNILKVSTIKAPNLFTNGAGATAGFILSVDGTGAFTWIQKLGFTGSTNFVSKFTSPNDISNSQIFDDGTFVGIGTIIPSLIGTKLEVLGGDITLSGGNKLNFDTTNNIKVVASKVVVTSTSGFLVGAGPVTYIDAKLDGIQGNKLDILNGMVSFKDVSGTFSSYITIPNLSYFGIGTASPTNLVHIFATHSGVFRLQDTSEGLGKVLISDNNGVGTWLSISGGGLSFSGGSFSIILSNQSGLTISNSQLKIDSGIGGYGITFSNGQLSTIDRYFTTSTITANVPTTITHGLGLTYSMIQLVENLTGSQIIGRYTNKTSNTVDITLTETTTVDITIQT
jgi:hypothetical protein